MTVVSLLPNDVLDLIIDTSYSSDGLEPLKALSLVSKDLCLLSRPLIFRRFSLDFHKMEQIHDYYIGGGPRQSFPSPLSSVRRLRVDILYTSSQSCLEALRFFTEVTHLRIYNWYFQDFGRHDVTHLLGHFGETVTRLKLKECFFDSKVLLFLISMFPLLDNLYVSPRVSCERETYRIKQVVPSRDVGFRGRLDLSYLTELHDQFLEFVTENSSAVHSISIQHCRSNGRSQELLDRLGGDLTNVDVGIAKGWGEHFPVLRSPTLRPRISQAVLKTLFPSYLAPTFESYKSPSMDTSPWTGRIGIFYAQ